MKRSTIVEIIAFLFIILFLYTGLSKLMDYSLFKEQIALSPIFTSISPWVAILIPATEIVISIALFIPRWRLKGLYASLALMLLFTGYITYIFNYNDKLPCSCGGVVEALSWKGHFVFNIIFSILALIAILLSRSQRRIKTDDPGQTPVAFS